MKTMVKRTLAATALATVALAGAATTAATTASASAGRSSGVAQPNCGGPNGDGCDYRRFPQSFPSYSACMAMARFQGMVDYYCTRDDTHGYGSYSLFYVPNW
ncbi:hypothetical protein [Actinomadura decatromicini]|uniref:hypothetical protein n=1 Tax=Actinomadura decatromicini TaxID=2604572 RepID=UPI0016530DF2|nr:hypothetical protein [Actinomadura decatromicini]